MTTVSWRDWSCRVDVTLDDHRTGDDDGALATAATATVRTLMAEVARAVSRFDPDSELERVNAAAGRLVPVGALAQLLVRGALDAAHASDGAVDPTVGAALLAAGYDADIAELRTRRPRPVGARPPRPDWRRVRVDTELGLVGVPVGCRLDLGATAKAWTADEAARRVATLTGRRTLVGIGGDLAVGHPGVGHPRTAPTVAWDVPVSEREGGPAQVVGLSYGGLATSSTGARRWRTTTGPAHHVIDPATGRPVEGPWRSASVWAPSCVAANVWSTAALVWGASAPERLTGRGVAARLVDHDGHVRTLGAWPVAQVAA
ncbi:FAD:protein FMN transferase [Nocardioides rubriscoriae]|uniref:FAD:protein FMN transferase n=1 Tax=Nocardioides rubriscoriae TaxID=642762 RepID=UPI001478FABD|nr:FAD:protein FMN transferase [Nocardioides rubriscoriae]